NKLIKDRSNREVYSSSYEIIIKEVYDEYSNNKIVKNFWSDLEYNFHDNDDIETLLNIDNRMKVIEDIFINYEGYKILIDSYINNLNFRVDDNLNIYTDASKNKDNHNSIGWVVINSQVIELELLAILAALMMVKENRKVNIYTDNMGVVELWSIKSHSNNLGNDLADGLCKAALLDKAKMEGLTVKLISTMIIHGNT
ncbi:17045_t:CDS:2, partial [Rhizophagus irregularis]